MRYLFFLFFLSLCFQNCTEELETQDLKKTIAVFNKQCPRMIDSETKAEGIELNDKNTLVYKFTLIHLLARQVDTLEFRKTLWPGILSIIKINEDLKEFRDKQMLFEYAYWDKENKFIYRFKIGPPDYNPR